MGQERCRVYIYNTITITAPSSGHSNLLLVNLIFS